MLGNLILSRILPTYIFAACHGMELTNRISSHSSSLGDARLLTCALDTELEQSCQWETPGGEKLLVNEEGKVMGNHGKEDHIKVFNSKLLLIYDYMT